MSISRPKEQFIAACPGFAYSSHPTPTSARYVFTDAHVCTSLDEAYAYAHVMNARLRQATEQERRWWDNGAPVHGAFLNSDDKLYIDTKRASEEVFAWNEVSGRHD